MTFLKPSTSYIPFKVYLMVFILNNVPFGNCGEELKCWPFNIVPFKIKPGFSLSQQNYIKKQVEKFNDNTCIYWIDLKETPIKNVTTYVSFQRRESGQCKSVLYEHPVTKMLFGAIIKLPDHCFEGGFVLHEMLHALGFEHEHRRIDRDCYVWVSESAKKTEDYKIESSFHPYSFHRFPYDKLSIMHYRRSGDLKALSERFYEWEPLGNEEEFLTDMDLWKIHYRYCGRPHYCDVFHGRCREMEKAESEMNCVVKESN